MEDSSHKKKHKWPITVLKCVQHPSLSGKWRLNLIWHTTSSQSEWLLLGTLRTNVREGVRKEEPFVNIHYSHATFSLSGLNWNSGTSINSGVPGQTRDAREVHGGRHEVRF